MNFFRKLFGLGPSEPNNKIQKTRQSQQKVSKRQNIEKSEEKSTSSTSYEFENPENHTVLPYLVSQKTRELNLNNEIVQSFHDREGIYSPVLVVISSLSDGKKMEIGHLNTENMDDEEFSGLLNLAYKNIESFNPNELVFWNSSDKTFDFDILTTTVSTYSSEKILSKKEMLKAHKMLNSKELIVSIGRKEAIFICGKSNLTEQQIHNFVNLHFYIILSNQHNTEILCEDLFVLEEGEIIGTIDIQQISDELKSKNTQ